MNFTLKIWRQKDAKAKGAFETYKVENISADTSFLEMLDILNNNLIHEGKEPVAFDHDCREGICGMCSLHIDGRAHGPGDGATTCQIYMRRFKDGATIVIEPWRSAAFPVIKDLVVANAPETKDNDFTWKDFQARNNNELVAVLGNFVNRALVLTHKYFDGAVPACGALTDYDRETLRELSGAKEALENNIENYRFREALKEAMNIARLGNKYLADTEPWKLIKTDPERVKTILNIALQITANLSIAIEPFMPFSAKKIVGMLQAGPFGWEKLGSTDLLAAGHRIGEAVLLFEKIEDDVIQRQLDKLAATKAANASAEAAQHVEDQKETTTFDDFQKMDIRVSTILAAEKVAKTKKLLKLTVDTGIDKREIVSGIAEYYTPEELVGKQVLVLVNLEPRELKGILSRGMILMAQDASGKLRLLQPDDQTNPGATVG